MVCVHFYALRGCKYMVSNLYLPHWLITDEGISPQVFINSLTESDVDELGFSFGAKKVLKGLLKDLKVHI